MKAWSGHNEKKKILLVVNKYQGEGNMADAGTISTGIYAATAVIGGVCGLGGLLIGYYKAKANFAETLQGYLSKEDCANCQLKTEVAALAGGLRQAAEDLREGAKLFSELRVDIAVIKVKLGVDSDLEELKRMVAHLENSRKK